MHGIIGVFAVQSQWYGLRHTVDKIPFVLSPMHTGDVKVNDCRCEFNTVNKGVREFFAPILANLTAL